MKFSLIKLRELANLPEEKYSLEQITSAINSLGFEVEEVIKCADVEGIKFGKVLKTLKNENSEKLTICKIKFNDKERTIQTTATNVKEGMTILAFVPGSRREDITFGAKEMAGVLSEGMLTSFGELGFDKDLLHPRHEGITEYHFDISEDPIKVLKLQDYIIDVDILSNRSDANSYLVMARELSAYFNTKTKELKAKTPTFKSAIKVQNGKAQSLSFVEVNDDFELTIEDEILLYKNGIKSINKFADLSNLILIMTGQPAHAYDSAKVKGPMSASHKSGKVKAFGKEVELNKNLVITSGNKIVSIAGVIGIEDYEVSDKTSKALIELGRFDAKDIRNNMISAKLQSKAGIQSAKIFGSGTTKLAIDYISSKVTSHSQVINFKESEPKEVPFSKEEISKVFGFDITKDKKYSLITKQLESLGFEIKKDLIKAPSYRVDVNTQQDINEEFFRFYGYNELKPVAPKAEVARVRRSDSISLAIALKGYNQVLTYTLVNEKDSKINPWSFKKKIELETFISKHHQFIRKTQLVSINKVIQYNTKQKIKSLNIFEIGYIQSSFRTIALASTTKTFKETLQDVVDIIGDVEVKRDVIDGLHPNISAKLFKGKEMVGIIGKVHPSISKTEYIFAEFIDKKDKNNFKLNEFKPTPLKHIDITYELKERDELSSFILKSKFFSIEIIDSFIDGKIRKITVRYIGDEEQLKEVKNA